MIGIVLTLALIGQQRLPDPGDVVYAYAQSVAPAPTSEDQVIKYREFIEGNDHIGLKKMVDDNELMLLDKDTQVRIIKVHPAGQGFPLSFHVRILDGKFKDKDGYMFLEHLRPHLSSAANAKNGSKKANAAEIQHRANFKQGATMVTCCWVSVVPSPPDDYMKKVLGFVKNHGLPQAHSVRLVPGIRVYLLEELYLPGNTRSDVWKVLKLSGDDAGKASYMHIGIMTLDRKKPGDAKIIEGYNPKKEVTPK